MASVNYLGSVNSICTTFPEVTELRWRRIGLDPFPVTEDLGIAPPNAYLPLTLEQVVFIHWRVRTWEVSYKIDSVSINKTLSQTYDFGGAFPSVTSTWNYNFSYPEKSFSFESQLPAFPTNERGLVCLGFNGLRTFNFFPLNIDLQISSNETLTFSDGSETEEQDFNRNETGQNLFVGAGGGIFLGLEESIVFDVGKIGNTYYWPLQVDLSLNITSENSDGFLFAESQADTDPPITGGFAPPIGGTLTTAPRGSTLVEEGVSTPHKVSIQVSPLEENTIQLDLFDVTTPSPSSNTRFNVDGFDGITIKPKLYWAYDPNDGGGPIYDTETGEQLRSFP